MSEQGTAFPPPAPGTAVSTVAGPTRLSHPVALFAVAFAIGIAAALLAGFGVGAVVYEMGASNCSPNDDFCDFGAVALGALAGFVIGAIAYAIAGVMTISRCRPTGSRRSNVIAHAAFPVATILIIVLASNIPG